MSDTFKSAVKQDIRYHKLCKAFQRYSRVKYNVGFKNLLQQSVSKPIVYGDLVYQFKIIVGKPSFHDQFKLSSNIIKIVGYTVLSANSDSNVIFCLQSYEGLMIDRSLVQDRINIQMIYQFKLARVGSIC